MNDLLAGLARWMLRLLLLAMGAVFFVSLLAAALVLALLWGMSISSMPWVWNSRTASR